MTFTLVHPLFAWLLPLAAAPVLFHLFFRIKKRPRPFSTLMFFHRIDPRLSARRKLMEWIILALRTLAILFLLLALARPVWFGAGTRGSVARVIVLDNSGSMTAKGRSNQTKLQTALGAADALLAHLKPEDSAAVVLTVDDPAVPLPRGLVSDQAALRAAVAHVKETEATGLAGNALARALALLDAAVATRYELHVLTDLQEVEWNKAAEPKTPRPGTLIFVHRLPTPADPAANVALLGADLPRRKILAGRRFALSVALANTTDLDARGRLNWTDDAGTKGLVEVSVPRRGESRAAAVLEPQGPGLHWANLWYEGDAFLADNRLSVAFLCADKRPVLLVSQRGAGGTPTPSSSGDFGQLPLALSPSLDGRLSGLVPVFVEPGALASALAKKKPALVVVTWETLPQAGGDALRAFVEAGGNLLVTSSVGAAPGPQETSDAGAPLLAFQRDAALFSDLRDAKGDVVLRNLRAFQFQPLRLAGPTTALFGLEDGRALLAESRLGNGTVFTSGLAFDTAWSTLPLKGGFLALAQGLALAGGDALEAFLSVTAGDRPLALLRGPEPIAIQTVAGSPLEWNGAAANLPVFPRSGVYAVRVGTNTTYVSVRSSDQEAQRQFITGGRVPALGSLRATVEDFTDVATLAAQARRTQTAMELFLPLLLLTMLCLALEGWLANPPPRKANGAADAGRRAAPSKSEAGRRSAPAPAGSVGSA